eukprot:scaffold23504_cov101-Isochrysis_galbana.AAC.1
MAGRWRLEAAEKIGASTSSASRRVAAARIAESERGESASARVAGEATGVGAWRVWAAGAGIGRAASKQQAASRGWVLGAGWPPGLPGAAVGSLAARCSLLAASRLSQSQRHNHIVCGSYIMHMINKKLIVLCRWAYLRHTGRSPLATPLDSAQLGRIFSLPFPLILAGRPPPHLKQKKNSTLSTPDDQSGGRCGSPCGARPSARCRRPSGGDGRASPPPPPTARRRCLLSPGRASLSRNRMSQTAGTCVLHHQQPLAHTQRAAPA